MPYTPRELRVAIQTPHHDGSRDDVGSDSKYLCVHLHAPRIHASCIHVHAHIDMYTSLNIDTYI